MDVISAAVKGLTSATDHDTVRVARSVVDMPSHDDGDGYVRIGALARALNRSTVTVRRWERIGLLPPARQRSVSHSVRGERRLYTRHEVQALRRAARCTGVLYLGHGSADFEAFAKLAQSLVGASATARPTGGILSGSA